MIARIRGYAKRTGNVYPLYDLTPEYGEVGKKKMLDLARFFPADLAGRVVAVTDSLFGIPATPFLWNGSLPTIGVFPSQSWPFLEWVEKEAFSFFDVCGLLLAVVVILALAARNVRHAFFIALFLAFLGAYPSLLFEFRHYFHLAFVPCFFAGMGLSMGCGGLMRLFPRRADQDRSRKAPSRKNMVRAAVVTTGPMIVLVVALVLLRLWQHGQWTRVFDAYDHADLSGIAFVETRDGNDVFLSLEESLAEMRGGAPLKENEVFDAYIALRFRPKERTVTFNLVNNNPILSRPCRINLRHGGTYFFPVFDYAFKPDFIFKGIRLELFDRDCLEGVYLFKNAGQLRLWPYVWIPEGKKGFAYCKSGRLDNLFSLMLTEIKSGFGLWPRTAIKAYENLIPAHSGFKPFVQRALDHALRCNDPETELAVWSIIGAHVPGMQREAGAWIAGKAEAARSAGDTALALRLYSLAASADPDEPRYLRLKCEQLEAQGEIIQATEGYARLLNRWPDNPGAAFRLHQLGRENWGAEKLGQFWKSLAEVFPQSVIVRLHWGLALEEQGNKYEAIDAYSKALELDPDQQEAARRKGLLCVETGRFEEGLQVLRQPVQEPSSREEIEGFLYDRGKAALDRQDFQVAVGIYQVLAGLLPDKPESVILLAEAYRKSGDLDRACSQYAALLDQHPDMARAARNLYELYRSREAEGWTDGPGKQVLFWFSLAEKYPQATPPWIYLGRTREDLGEIAQARDAYLRALHLSPDCAEALYRLGALDILAGEEVPGLERMDRAAALNAGLAVDIAGRLLEVGEEFMRAGEYEKASRMFEKASVLTPEDIWPCFRAGESFEQSGRVGKALEVFAAILSRTPESKPAAERLNELLGKHPDLRESIDPWRRLVEEHPQVPLLRVYEGAFREQSGDYAGARQAYEFALHLREGMGEAAYRLAALDVLEGGFEEGRMALDRIARQYPALAGEISSKVQDLARRFAESGELSRARTLYESAREIMPGDLGILVCLGEICERMGDREEAMNAYRGVLRQIPESPKSAQRLDVLLAEGVSKEQRVLEWCRLTEQHPDAAIPWFHLGLALDAANDAAEAEKAYARAVELSPEFVQARERLELIQNRQATP